MGCLRENYNSYFIVTNWIIVFATCLPINTIHSIIININYVGISFHLICVRLLLSMIPPMQQSKDETIMVYGSDYM